MQNSQPSLIARDDTLFGVCAALGEDFGFNPLYLRVAFALLLFLNPVAAVGGYFGAGAIVALSRWLAPNPRPAVPVEAAAEPDRPEADAKVDADPLPIAA